MSKMAIEVRDVLAQETANMIGVDAWLRINSHVTSLMCRGPITGDELQALANDIWQRRQMIIDKRKRFRGEA